MSYYTVDVSSTYRVGTPIRLQSAAWAGATQPMRPEDFGTEPSEAICPPARAARAKSMFPNGLSFHGITVVNPGYGLDDRKRTYESAYEVVREAEFPQCVSRLRAVFACEELADAQAWRDQRRSEGHPRARICEVTAEKSDTLDMRRLPEREVLPPPAELQDLARVYWGKVPSAAPFWETLLEPPVAVLRVDV